MITFRQKGDFSKLTRFLERAKEAVHLGDLDKYGRAGVAALASATFRLRQSEKIFDRITAALYDNEKERPWIAEEPAVHRLEILTGTASDCAGK